MELKRWLSVTGIAASCVLTLLLGELSAGTAIAAQAVPPGDGSRVDVTDPFTFTEIISPLVSNGLGRAQAAWGDYDNHGQLDLLLSGCLTDNIFGCNTPYARIYHNAPFTDTSITFPENGTLKAAWGDVDNDGRLDVALTGINGADFAVLIYTNTAGLGYHQAYVIGVSASTFAWGDADGDGRSDLLVGSWNTFPGQVVLYRNTGSGFAQVYTLTTDTAGSSLAWGDYDNDGRPDVLMSPDNYGSTGAIFHNTGVGFTQAYTLPTLAGSAVWGDYDNDGYLDIENSLFSSNTASRGAGIFNGDPSANLTLANTTFSGNTADRGSDIDSYFLAVNNSVLQDSHGGAGNAERRPHPLR